MKFLLYTYTVVSISQIPSIRIDGGRILTLKILRELLNYSYLLKSLHLLKFSNLTDHMSPLFYFVLSLKFEPFFLCWPIFVCT